jgi:hypothetical protein
MTVKTNQEKLSAVETLLKSGKPEKALQTIDQETHDPDLLNARGVCLLRLNKVKPAMDIFKRIVFQNFISIPPNTPPLYIANYLTALLMDGATQTALDLENYLNGSDHSYVTQLKQTMQNWKQALPWHQRILCGMNLYPNKPLALPFEPGGI